MARWPDGEAEMSGPVGGAIVLTIVLGSLLLGTRTGRTPRPTRQSPSPRASAVATRAAAPPPQPVAHDPAPPPAPATVAVAEEDAAFRAA